MSNNNAAARETFSAGRLLVRRMAPYLRAIVLGFAPIEVEGLGTIGATEHGVLMIDWEFIAQVNSREMAGLLVHEALHLLLKHSARAKRAGRNDADLNNRAADLAINSMILDMGFELPGGGPGETLDHPLHGLYPEDFGLVRGLTTDEYYRILLAQKEGRQAQKEAQAQKQAQGEAQGQKPGEGGGGGGDDHNHAGQGGQGGDRPHAGGGWCGSCAGRPVPNEPDAGHAASRSTLEIERLVRQVAEAVRQEATRGRGNVPAGLCRWAEEILAPPEVPWERELAVATRAAVAFRANAVDHRYDAPSRRQAGIGYGPGRPILPRFRQPVPNVDVIVDTSGSMGSAELGEAVREVAGILKSIGAAVRFTTCDAEVSGITQVRSPREAMAALKGGGGTDMRAAFDALMRERPSPEVIVCITDGMIGDPGPEPRGVQVIWVLVGPYQDDSDLTWGRVIRKRQPTAA